MLFLRRRRQGRRGAHLAGTPDDPSCRRMLDPTDETNLGSVGFHVISSVMETTRTHFIPLSPLIFMQKKLTFADVTSHLMCIKHSMKPY